MKIKKSTAIILIILFTLGAAALASAKGETSGDRQPGLKGQVNINTATEKELGLLPGIGKKTAANIIQHRNQNGNFTNMTTLLKVNGIGKKTLAKIKGYIVFKGETTLAKKK